MSLLKFEAQILGNNSWAEIVDEACKDDCLWLLLEGVQDDVKHPSRVEVKETYQRLHLLCLHWDTSLSHPPLRYTQSDGSSLSEFMGTVLYKGCKEDCYS